MDVRRWSPACERNQEPIRRVLQRWLPEAGTVLEVASGSGQHAAYFGRAFADLAWQPTDRSDEGFDSIRAWTEGLPNVRLPLVLDVTAPSWPVGPVAAIFNANMIHISPWPTTLGLFRGASHVMSAGGPVVLYGPFLRQDHPTAESNSAFDQSLRQRDPSWGIRQLEDVDEVASWAGFARKEVQPMPANNLMVRYERA